MVRAKVEPGRAGRRPPTASRRLHLLARAVGKHVAGFMGWTLDESLVAVQRPPEYMRLTLAERLSRPVEAQIEAHARWRVALPRCRSRLVAETRTPEQRPGASVIDVSFSGYCSA